jgi:hypothetical protein
MRKMLLICTIALGLGLLMQQNLSQKASKGPSLDRIMVISDSEPTTLTPVIEEPKRITPLKISQAIPVPDLDLPDLGDSELVKTRLVPPGETGTDGLWRSQIQRANQTLNKAGLSDPLR